MRTRSNRTYSDMSWQRTFNFASLMRQAPASTATQPPTYPSDSDHSESTLSPPPRRHTCQRRGSSHPVSRPARTDLVLRNVAILGVVLAVTLLFVNLALYLAIFLVGILAPAWQTFKLLEIHDRPVVVDLDGDDPNRVAEPRQLRNWQAYWVIAALLLTLDGLVFSPFLSNLIPGALYHSILFTLVTWLTRNSAANAAILYDAYVKPAFKRSENTIDGVVESAITHVDSVSQRAILAVNEAVAPYARHLEHAANSAAHQMQEQNLAHSGRRVTGHRRSHHR